MITGNDWRKEKAHDAASSMDDIWVKYLGYQ
jgi:hypothetical protein